MLLEVQPYSKFVAVSQDINSDTLKENVAATDFVIQNPKNRMRNYQDKYSLELRNKMRNLSLNGQLTLYILTACCIFVVILSIGLTFPVFIWVIKDKSYVLAIFANITADEIKVLIDAAANFDIRLIKYKKKWILGCVGDEDKFWKTCMKGNRDLIQGKENDEKIKKLQKKHTPVTERSVNDNRSDSFVRDIIAEAFNAKVNMKNKNEKSKMCPQNLQEQQDSQEKQDQQDKKDKKEACKKDKSENNQDDQFEQEINPMESVIQEENMKKLELKRKILGTIDTDLRNTAIFRLAIILAVFLVYGGVSLYFNYYIHYFNNTTMTQFYTLLNRSLYMPTITCLMRLSLIEKTKLYVEPNLSIFRCFTCFKTE